MRIQRWDRDEEDMHDHPEGDYVLFTDHEQVVAELDGVIEQRDALDVACLDMEREITRLRAELAAKSKDAERYQWLRKIENRRGLDAGESLDRYIDTAMGEGNGR